MEMVAVDYSRSDMPPDMPLDVLLESATREDLRRAAEAILEAAIWKQRARGEVTLTPSSRDALIRAIIVDPEMTELLFSGVAFQPH